VADFTPNDLKKERKKNKKTALFSSLMQLCTAGGQQLCTAKILNCTVTAVSACAISTASTMKIFVSGVWLRVVGRYLQLW
jgi:cytochrome P450